MADQKPVIKQYKVKRNAQPIYVAKKVQQNQANRWMQTKFNQQRLEIQALHQKFDQQFGDPNYATATSLYTENAEARQLIDGIRKITTGQGQYQKLLALLGYKEMAHLDKHFEQANLAEKKQMLAIALGDNLWSVLSPILSTALKTYAPKVIDSAWQWAKSTDMGKRLTGLLKEHLGVNLNDGPPLDPFIDNNSYTFPTKGFQVVTQPTDTSLVISQPEKIAGRGMEGVNLQALISIIDPSIQKVRIPEMGECTPTGLTNKHQIIQMFTNAAGACAYYFRPTAVAAIGTLLGTVTADARSYCYTKNGADFNVNSGAGTMVSSGGPLKLWTDITKYAVTAFTITINVICPPLTTSGYVTAFVWDEPITASWISDAAVDYDVGLDTAILQSYVFQCSTASATGKRIMAKTFDKNGYVDIDQKQGSLLQPGGIGIIIAGATPSTAVLELDICYQVEFQGQGALGQIADYVPPPQGPATLAVLSSALGIRPELRFLGKAEVNQLSLALTACQPIYQSTLDCLLTAPMTKMPGIPRSNHPQFDNPEYSMEF